MLFELRLGHIINTLPRYDNKFKRGPYKNGNIARVTVVTKNHNGVGNCYDINNMPREFFEAPWYIKLIKSEVLSAHGNKANCGLIIELLEEENQYE